MDCTPTIPRSGLPTPTRRLAPPGRLAALRTGPQAWLVAVAVLGVLAITGCGSPAAAWEPDASEPLVEVIWTADYLPHGDPTVAVLLVIEDARACRLAPDAASLDGDPGRGVVVAIGDVEIYRTGADNIVIDDAYALQPGDEPGAWASRSLVEYFAADSFLVYSAWPLDDQPTADVTVSCLADDDSSVEVVNQAVTVPALEEIFPFISGVEPDPDDGRVGLSFADPSYTVAFEDWPEPDGMSVTIDGQSASIENLVDPEFGLIDGAFTVDPGGDLAPGRHQLEVVWNDRSQIYPVVVDDLASLSADPRPEGPSEPRGDLDEPVAEPRDAQSPPPGTEETATDAMEEASAGVPPALIGAALLVVLAIGAAGLWWARRPSST